MSNENQKVSVVLVTGPSGAGRSTAIKSFEDLGFETIDNLPLDFVPRLMVSPAENRPMALSIDVRTRGFSGKGVIEVLDAIESSEFYEPTLLYVDCAVETLLNRYSETRRRHPMSPDGPPIQGIREELDLLDGLRARADVLIDTTKLTLHDLRAEISNSFRGRDGSSLAVSLQSFSYKRGVPRGIDMAMDCRFLRNPFWDETLRSKNGLDSDVKAYVKKDARYTPFFDQLSDMIALLLPAYKEEGKSHFSVGLGCTGGQHRSVCIAEELAEELAKRGWRVSVRHREIERRDLAVS
jgi:UPF0042 nucleotide-binding protein